MTSISTASELDSMMNHYNKIYNDVEKSKNDAIRQERKAHQQDVDSVNSANQKTFDRREKEVNQLTDRIRTEAESLHNSDQKSANESLDKLRQENYNNKGLLATSVPVSEHNRIVQDLSDASERRHQVDLSNSKYRESELNEINRENMRHAEQETQRNKDQSDSSLSELINSKKRESTLERQDATNTIEKTKKAAQGEIEALRSHDSEAYRNLKEVKEIEANDLQRRHHQELSDLKINSTNQLNRKEDEINGIMEVRKKETEATNHVKEKTNHDVIERLQKENYKNKGILATSLPFADFKRILEDQYQSNQKQRANDLSSAKNKQDDLERLVNNTLKKADDEIFSAKERNDAQISNLTQDFNVRSELEKTDKNKILEEMRNRVALQEKEKAVENKRLDRAYSDDLRDLQKASQAKEKHYDEQVQDQIKAKNEFLTKTLNQQRAEADLTKRNLEKTHTEQLDHLKHEKELQNESAYNRLNSMSESDNAKLADTITKQIHVDEHNQEHLAALSDARYNKLSDEFRRKTHPTNAAEIPVDLEKKIEHGVSEHYEKTLQTELTRNKNTQEKMAEKYTKQYQQTVEDFKSREALIRRQNEIERSQDRDQFYETLSNFKNEAATKVKDQEQAFRANLEALQKKFATAMEKQKHKYDFIIEQMQNEHDQKLFATRSNNEKQTATNLNTYTEKQNEILQDYDKRLTEQREQYESMIQDLLNETRNEIHRTERQSREELEGQSKSYEQKMAQMDHTHSDYERTLDRNFQEQLDKVRKFYEFTNKQKKS
jgi:hypothetical protein